ncbi:unnamed protein product [Bemisia tabaci]|uniref:Ferric-chelate reductase 1 n=1 Tax=Bemisia tabaci TaxID=7038 RepID=A0A9P0EX10_BEMTA|nr:unnamed protein product [Bemisia tabaci]
MGSGMGLSALTLLLLGAVELCGGYKAGAPLFACRTMTPGHGAPAQSDLAPYTLSADPVGPPDAGRVRVNLVAPRGAFFVGYLIQARNLKTEDAVGSFVRVPQDASLIDCGNKGSAITQRDNKRKRTVDVDWEAPDGWNDDVQFLATVVLNYTTFWTKMESDAIQIVKRGAPPQRPADVNAPQDQDLSAWENQLYSGCGSTKNCVGAPPNCFQSKTCTAVGTISRQNDGNFLIEMLAKNSKYVAYGFSDDIKMGGDAVIECEGGDDGRVQAFRSWNVPNNKKNVRRPEDQVDFSLQRSLRSDGAIACSLVLSSQFSALDSETFRPIQFDLDNNEYHALLAAGSALKQNTVGFHDVAYVSSPEKKVLSNYRKVIKRDEIFDGCGATKNCFGIPQGCIELQSCTAVATFMVQGTRYIFEMKANGAAYVAVGLSEDNKMGGDAVMECVHEGSASSNSIRAYTSWNKPGDKANERLGENGITLLNGTYVDGTIYCKLIRDPVTTVKGKVFDLTRDEYNVLLAAGSTLKPSGVGYHDVAVDATAQKKALSDVSAFTASTKIFVHLHGVFMVSAWIGAASIGIVLARYYKQTWVGSRLCTKDQWFAWHRFLMVITWLLSVSGGIIIFYEVGGWVQGPSETHALLGVITTSLAFIQPIGAYLRPHPESSKRWVFNWLHWLIGNGAHIVGIVTIFLAVEIGKAELPPWTDWILVAYVAYYVLVHLILSVSGCMSEQQKQQRVNSFPMKDMHLSRSPSYIERKSDAPYSGFRKFILFLYVLGIIAVTAVLNVMIVYAPIEKNWDSMKEMIMP